MSGVRGVRVIGQWNRISHQTRVPCLHPAITQQCSLHTSPKLSSDAPKFGKKEIQEFQMIFPDIVMDLTTGTKDEYKDLKLVQKWMTKMLQYNLPGGTKNRGLTVVQVYQAIAPTDLQYAEHMKLCRIMGWCVETLHSFFLIQDDIMDNSDTRRTRLSWHKNEEVGLNAINDAVLMEHSIYQLLDKHFSKQTYYQDVVHLFHEATLRATMGSSLDILTSSPKRCREKHGLEKFTMDRYNTIVKYKYVFYSFYLPIALAMHMAGINKPELFRQAQQLTTEIGHFYQVQMDYLDNFGPQSSEGYRGTDIKNDKCSWLIVMALQKCNPEQRKVLEEHYGKKEESSIFFVREIYDELDLDGVFKQYSDDQYQYLHRVAHQTSVGLPQSLFINLMNRIFKI